MKNKILKVFASLSLLALVVAGCDTIVEVSPSDTTSVPTPSVDNSSPSADTSSPSVDNSSPSVDNSSNGNGSTSEVEEYNVSISQAAMSTVQASVNKAKAGETVTVTVTPQSGFIISKVEMNGKTMDLSIDSNDVATFTFVMPNTTARISVFTDLKDKSGFIITGDVTSAKLVETEPGSGLYVARNVSVPTDTHMGYSADGGATMLSVVKINNHKSFANLGLSTDSTKRNGFTIAGNAVYDFYYDTNDIDTPCYVQRVDVIDLPTTSDALYALLDGEVKSASTVYPVGLNHVEYVDESANVNYTWDLYSNNSSLAKVTDLTGRRDKGLVYKAQNDNKYTVVNTYIEKGSAASDRTKVYDLENIAFSGQFDIVDGVSNRTNYTQKEVDIDANFYSHSTSVLEMKFYEAYRNGYMGNVMDDVEVAGDTTITSSELNADGDFEVKAATWVRWENSSYYNEKNAYKTFNAAFTFTKAGALKTAKYEAYTYNDKYYDFATKQLLSGYEAVDPDEYIEVTYSYGDAKTGQPNIDITPYFVSSLDTVTVKGKNSEVGSIGINEAIDYLSYATGTTNEEDAVMEIQYSPATALDAWQYQIRSSKDNSIIALNSRGEYIGLKAGNATVVIGNGTVNSNKVTKEVAIEVSKAAYIRSAYLYTVYEGPNYDETWASSFGTAVAGRSYDLLVAGTNINGGPEVKKGLEITFEITAVTTKSGKKYSADEIKDFAENTLKLSYNNDTGMMTVDASNATSITENMTIKVKLHSPYFVKDEFGQYDRDSTITITLVPGEALPESLVGEYRFEDPTLNTTDKLIFNDNASGSIYLYDENGENEEIYNFSYTYDNQTGEIKASVTTTGGNAIDGDIYTLKLVLEGTKVGIGLYAEKLVYGQDGMSSEITPIMGGVAYDDEGYPYLAAFSFFAKNA